MVLFIIIYMAVSFGPFRYCSTVMKINKFNLENQWLGVPTRNILCDSDTLSKS